MKPSRFLGSGLRLEALLAILCIGLVGVVIAAPGASVDTNNSTSADRQTEFDVTISGIGEEDETRWKDFHLEAVWESCKGPPPIIRPIDCTEVEVCQTYYDEGGIKRVKRTKFDVTQSADGAVHMTLQEGEEPLSNGDYYFTIKYKGAEKFRFARPHVSCTMNGEVEFDGDDTIPTTLSPTCRAVPIVFSYLYGPDPEAPHVACVRGGTTPLEVCADPTLTGLNYQIYHSLAVEPTYSDLLEIGIHSETLPVPGGWGLTFEGLMGQIDPDGDSTVPVSISVPNDPGLSGSTFYFVLAVKDPSGEIIVICDPVTVTIL